MIISSEMPAIVQHLRSVVLQLFQQRQNVLSGTFQVVFQIVSALHSSTAGDLTVKVRNELVSAANQVNSFLTGNAVYDVMFYGKGAGPATGSAIVGDIIAIMKALQK